jgi:hypothetical protein
MAKRKPPKRPLSADDYVLVIEDAEGRQLATIIKTDYSRAPHIGEDTRVREREVKDAPHLAGTYVVHRVSHIDPPEGDHTIDGYQMVWCFARRSAESRPQIAQPLLGESGPAPDEAGLAQLDGGNDVVASVAQELRNLATDLGEHSDKLAEAVRTSDGKLDPRLHEEAHQLSRRAKQRYADLLLNPRPPTPTRKR